MAPTRIILMSCGSYNPPTDMHLRMFELARDHLHRMGTHVVVGAVISPTHDDYAKKELVSAEHRCSMLKLATQNSDWIKVSTWETRQNGWTKTKLSLQHHQNLLNSLLLDSNDIKHCMDIDDMDWIPEKVKNSTDLTPIQIKLLCGADLLESFGTPGLWADEDIDAIVGQHGLVVITREGSNPHKFIYESDILSNYMHNIHIVINWIRHEVSSTKIRKAFKRGDSVKYEIQDSVIEYVYKHGLYGAKTVSTIKLELSSKNGNDYLNIQQKYQSAFLTPSPSDITMTTPSPVEIISIDISESVLKKNYQNSPSFSKSRPSTIDETERIREKFINVISENGNKLLASNKSAYPGQAKQIIATETGESQIFCEVGLGCISEKYKSEMEIDGGGEQRIADKIVLDFPCKVDCSDEIVKDTGRVNVSKDPSPLEALETLRSSDQTISPDDSESKVSVVLAMDVPDAPNIDSDIETVKPLLPLYTDEKRADAETANSLESPESESRTDKEHRSLIILIPSTSRYTDGFEPPTNAKTNDSDDIIEAGELQQEIERGEGNPSAKSDETITESAKHLVECQHKHETISQAKSKVSEGTSLPTTIEESPIENMGPNGNSNSPTNEAERSESESATGGELPKRDANIGIDGKYIKSLVNSRKSPKKVKNDEEQESILAASTSSILESGDAPEKAEQSKDQEEPDKSPSDTPPSSSNLKDVKDAISVKSTKSCVKFGGRRRGVLFQGSLDSINVTQPKSLTTANTHQPISKKSKSYELIKSTNIQPTIVYKIPSTDLKSDRDSTSVFMTANEANDANDAQTDEFCSVCCYANDPSTEVFFTLRSTASSPLEEDSTECDICSNCDLQENEEDGNFKGDAPAAPGEPICELCEICDDRAMDEDVVASSRPEKDDFVDRRLLASRPLPLSLPKKKKGFVRIDARTFDNIDNDDEEDNFETDHRAVRKRETENRDNVKMLRSKSIDEQSTDNSNSNDDEFEIENCGLDLDIDFKATKATSSRYKSEVEDTFRQFVPRDEIAMSGKSANKMTRAGSLVSRDTVDRSKAKRRYSSVDNLQNSRQIVKSTPDKQNSLKSRGIVKGLVASADNIRPMRSSRSRSLRKSADDVGRGYNSSMDDTREGPLYENIERKKLDVKDQQKPRDSGTIKMILTKHGIKIISDKETAL